MCCSLFMWQLHLAHLLSRDTSLQEMLAGKETMRCDPPANHTYHDRVFANEMSHLVQVTDQHYEAMMYREAVKSGFYDLQVATPTPRPLDPHLHVPPPPRQALHSLSPSLSTSLSHTLGLTPSLSLLPSPSTSLGHTLTLSVTLTLHLTRSHPHSLCRPHPPPHSVTPSHPHSQLSS